MGSTYRRMLAAAALIFTMSAIVGLVVLSPLVWRDGPSSEPAAEAVPTQGRVAEVVASPKAPPTKPGPDKSGPYKPVGARLASPVNPAIRPPVEPGPVRPLQRPVISDKTSKAKGHEKKGLGSKKAGKHGHYAQGAPGKGHGKGKSKDRDRAPARARG
jgi:hypothetical protein